MLTLIPPDLVAMITATIGIGVVLWSLGLFDGSGAGDCSDFGDASDSSGDGGDGGGD